MALPSLGEIKQRKLVQWGVAYLGGAWLVLQVVAVLGATYGWPRGLLRAVPVVLEVGFLVALVVASYYGEKGGDGAVRGTGAAMRAAGLERAAAVPAGGRGGVAPPVGHPARGGMSGADAMEDSGSARPPRGGAAHGREGESGRTMTQR